MAQVDAYSFLQGRSMKLRGLTVSLCALLFLLLTVRGAAASAQTANIGAQSSPLGTMASAPGLLPQKDGTILELGNPVERVLSRGAQESFQVFIQSGRYLRFSVIVRGISVVATLLSPSEKSVAHLKISARQGATSIHAIASESGAYRVEIFADSGTPQGNYQLRVEELRSAQEQDTRLIKAQELFRQGGELSQKRTPDSLSRAIEPYKEALDLWKAAEDLRNQAEALESMGLVYNWSHDLPKALAYDEQALAKWKLAGDKGGETEVLFNIAVDYFDMGDRQKARDYASAALEIARSTGDIDGQFHALNSLGLAYRYLGDPQKALECYTESLRLGRYLEDKNETATVLSNVAVLYGYLGETQKALETFNQALVAPRVGDSRAFRALVLDNIGKLYNTMGEKQKALQYLNEALEINRDLGNSEANNLNSIALVYASLGDNDKALELFHKSLSMVRAAKNRDGESAVLYNLGRVYRDSGNDDKALQFLNEALVLNRSMNNPEGIGSTLQQIGKVHADKKEWRAAIDTYGEALTVLRSARSRRKEASALNDLGTAYASLGRMEEAFESLTAALSISREVTDPYVEALCLYGMGRVERTQGKLAASRDHIEAALQVVETTRTQAPQELRASYLASVTDYYRLYIDVLAQLHTRDTHAGYDVKAFEVSERARARSLLDLLNEAGINVREGVDPQLLDREHTLEQFIRAKSEREIRLLSGKHTDAEAELVKKELNEIVAQFEEVEGHIRTVSPRYAALTQPRPLTAKEIQTQILDADTMLLEYALGEKASYVWAVTQNSVDMVQLPPGTEIEASAKRVYELLATNNPAEDEHALAANRTLSQLVLGSVGHRLGTKRLVIVADGALQYLPFGALLQPEFGKDGQAITSSTARLLITDHEIVSLPSASTLAVLRQESRGRKTAAKAVAVFADPVFSRDDSRIKQDQARTEEAADQQVTRPHGKDSPNEDLKRSGKESGVLRFDRLPSTRKEAEEIQRLTRAGDALMALGFRANRTTATSEEVGGYRIVHLASHALLNVQHPELSGLVLSLVDEQGRPQDGFLRLQDIYNLKLSADLVVLSACETALGADIKGEGLVGLTRGFMYAGAPRVVASLWRVPDKATAELMKRFYKNMLVDGLPPAAALRAAQVAMTKERRWAKPYYWAAFILQGEWQ